MVKKREYFANYLSIKKIILIFIKMKKIVISIFLLLSIINTEEK